MEGLAEGGGICISGTVYDQVKDKLTLRYDYLGKQKIKNIAQPMRAYRVLTEPLTSAARLNAWKRRGLDSWKRIHPVFKILIALVAAGNAVWQVYPRFSKSPFYLTPKEKIAYSLSRKPSIAVLPFVNMSDDPKQEYFSDGISNDIMTDLSRFKELLVIASNTVFTYKGKPVSVKEIGQELGVRYVVEGSVQKRKDEVRINAQLIFATTGQNLWAERYDRDLKDLFEVQEEIVKAIVRTLAVKIDEAERKRAKQKNTESLEAYDYQLRGREFLRLRTRSGRTEARRMFEKALELDPNYSSAYVGLAQSYLRDFSFGWAEFPDKALQQAQDFAEKALSIDASNEEGYVVLGNVYSRRGQYDIAMDQLNRALELNPNDALSLDQLGRILLFSGRTDDAIRFLESDVRLDPFFALQMPFHLGLAYYLKGRYEDAVKVLEQGVSRRPDITDSHVALAATYAQMGRIEDASREVALIPRLDPFFDLGSYGTAFKNPADRNAILKGLRKAGLK
jgi:adenylate cyclase